LVPVTSGTAELVDGAAGAIAGQDGGGGRRIVGPGGSGHPAIPGGGDDLALGQVLGELVGVVLGVPAVPQGGVLQPGYGQELLGGFVLGRKDELARVRSQDAGVRDPGNPGCLGRLDHVSVLGDTLVQLAPRDEQQAVDAGQRHGQGLGLGVFAASDVDTPDGQVPEPRGRPGDGYDVGRGHAGFEQRLDGQAAEGAGRSGDGIGGHDLLPGHCELVSANYNTALCIAMAQTRLQV
jgi:hypothetical protein